MKIKKKNKGEVIYRGNTKNLEIGGDTIFTIHNILTPHPFAMEFEIRKWAQYFAVIIFKTHYPVK